MPQSKAGIFTKLLTGAMIACGVLGASASAALAETRTLKLYFIHTGEKAEITFKRNGRYDADGLKKLNNFLRDWRRNEPTRMDPRLFDLVWENYRASGASGYINVVSGYRSPSTNSMLRSRSKGVAEKSQHMLGKAMDFYIPGVKLKTLRDNALRLQGGGVGYYPNSGSPFVHMDVGNVRHWPGISRRELVSIFPNGKTLHVPSDGKPLPGYEQALASYKSRQSNGNLGIALASSGGTKRSGGLLAALFGGGADEEEDVGETQVAAAPPKPVRQAPAKQTVVATAAPAPQPRAVVPGIQVISPENARRVDLPLADTAPVAESPETVVAALPARSVPVPAFAPRPQAEVAPAQQQLAAVAETPAGPRPPSDIPFGMASGEPAPDVAPTTAETGLAMANVPVPTRRPDHKPEPDQTLMALAVEPAPLQAAVNAPIPAARPQDLTAQAAAKAKAETASASQPLAVPAPAPAAQQQPETTIAALTAEEPASAFNPPAPATAPAARVQAPTQAKPQVVAAAAPTAPVEAGAKTTSKAARPMAQDTKPDRKTVVVAAEPKAARWALNSNQTVVNVSDSTTAPRFAYNMVRTAPKEVYTAGFQAEGGQSDAHRFSGSAVKFLSVARFATN